MANDPHLELRSVTCAYAGRPVVSDISLTVERGARVGIAGRSGSGKTTLARAVTGFLRPHSGTVLHCGQNPYALPAAQRRSWHAKVQLVWQGSATTFHPSMTVEEALAEPLIIQQRPIEPAREWLHRVGLPETCLPQRAATLSGGQQQRLAIARALVLEPELLVLDEATSNLDLSIQAFILNLLLQCNRERGLTLLFISHDFGFLRAAAGEIAVLDKGRLVERGFAGALHSAAARELMDAVLPEPC